MKRQPDRLVADIDVSVAVSGLCEPLDERVIAKMLQQRLRLAAFRRRHSQATGNDVRRPMGERRPCGNWW
jgi:hypothetical protein